MSVVDTLELLYYSLHGSQQIGKCTGIYKYTFPAQEMFLKLKKMT